LSAFEKILVLFSGHRKTAFFLQLQKFLFITAQCFYNCTICTLKKPWSWLPGRQIYKKLATSVPCLGRHSTAAATDGAAQLSEGRKEAQPQLANKQRIERQSKGRDARRKSCK